MIRFQGFIGPSYTLRTVNLDCQRCVNFYPELDEIGTGKEKEVAALIGTPGLRLLLDVSATLPCRGTFTTSTGALLTVIGREVHYVKSDWTSVVIGTLISTTGPVSMADNGKQVMIVDGQNGYLYSPGLSPVFQQIPGDSFMGGTRVMFQDGYFLVNRPGTGEMRWSDLYDGTLWPELNFVTAEGTPDPLVTILSDHREVWMFGTQSTEVFFNSGGQNTFERIQGAFIEYGCAAPFTPQKVNNAIIWLAVGPNGSGIVLKTNGYTPQRISNHAIELAIQGYGDLSATVAWTYQQDGHHFYCLSFTNAKTTWVYDDATGIWHERTYTHLVEGQQRHRALYHAFAYNTHVVGDWETGKLYALDPNVYSDNGNPITRLRTSPHLSKDMKRVAHNAFQLDMETGVGVDGAGQGVDPQVMLSYSDDYGHSWSNEHWSSAGKIGEFRARAKWYRLGATRDRVYRLKVTDPIKCNFLGAQLTLTEGRS